MKRVYIVLGQNGILNTVGPVGGAVTQELADRLSDRQAWKLDTRVVIPVDIAETEDELKEWAE